MRRICDTFCDSPRQIPVSRPTVIKQTKRVRNCNEHLPKWAKQKRKTGFEAKRAAIICEYQKIIVYLRAFWVYASAFAK